MLWKERCKTLLEQQMQIQSPSQGLQAQGEGFFSGRLLWVYLRLCYASGDEPDHSRGRRFTERIRRPGRAGYQSSVQASGIVDR